MADKRTTQTDKNSKRVKTDKERVKELEERLSILEKIQSENLKPKSEVRVTGKQVLPLLLGVFFALCSGLAVYGVASSVRFYSDYGEISSLLVSLGMLFALMLLIGIAAWTIHRSEWGYKFRYTVVWMIVLFSSIGIGAVLMQGPVERMVDKFGLNDRLRAEDRLFGNSTVYGKVSIVTEDRIRIEIMGGGFLNVDIDKDTKVYPIGARVSNGQLVGVILKTDSKTAKWIRVLPPNHPLEKAL